MFGSEATHALVQDKEFVSWARNYLVQMANNVVVKDFDLLDKLKASAKLMYNELQAIHWTTFYRHNYATDGNLDFTSPFMKDFLPALRHIYNFTPGIVKVHEDMKRLGRKKQRGKKRRRKDLPPFKKFASAWLKRFFIEVVPEPNHMHFMWGDLKNAARLIKSKETFQNIDRFQHVSPQDAHVKNKALKVFIAPLRHIYDNLPVSRSAFVNKGGEIGFSWSQVPYGGNHQQVVSGNGKTTKLTDLRDIPADEIDVVAYPVELKSKMEDEAFRPLVIKVLTHMLKKGYKSISSEQLADFFKVDQREFEKWADACPDLVCKESLHTSRIYYGLKPLGDLKMSKRVTSDVSGHTETCRCQSCCEMRSEDFHAENCICSLCRNTDCECEFCTKKKAKATEYALNHPETELGRELATEAAEADLKSAAKSLVDERPAMGTDEFDTFITKFLSEDKDKPWRSSDAVTMLGYDEKKFDDWALKNPAITRRISTKATNEKPKMLYALVARLVPKQEPAAKVEPEKNGEKKEEKKDKKKDDKKKVDGSSITMQEVLAFAMIHNISDSLVRTMNFYANSLATRHPEAFSHLTKAQKDMMAAVALLQKGAKVNDNKLPPLTDI